MASESAPMPPRENLFRATPEIGIRAAGDGLMPSLVGHFAVWNQWTEIRSAYEGNFMERFSPTSMTKTLAESRPKVLFQHGKDPSVGDKVLGPVRSLAPDETGAAYDVQLLDTSYNRDLLPGLEAGLYGASFRFKVMKESFQPRPRKSEYNPRGIPERTVTEAQVMEFGPVTFPAYEGATAGLRSMTDEFLFDALAEDPERLQHLAERRRLAVSFAKRFDSEDISCIAQMLTLATCFIDDQDETSDASALAAMQGIAKSLTSLLPGEIAEDEPDEPDDEMNAAPNEGVERNTEPDPSGDTTPEPGIEPEPPEATTRSIEADHFWFASPPKHLRSK